MVVFIPVILAEMVKRLSKGLTGALVKNQYYLALMMFAITNMGIFSKYSEFFYQRPMIVGAALLASVILGALYLVAGLLLSWGRPVEDQLAAVICLGIMNNVLVMVFSSQFFSPLGRRWQQCTILRSDHPPERIDSNTETEAVSRNVSALGRAPGLADFFIHKDLSRASLYDRAGPSRQKRPC
jgi:hypothetical protein